MVPTLHTIHVYSHIICHLCMLLLDVSLEPLERVGRLVVDLTALPETEE